MTLEEATALGAIIQTADGGCSVCVGNLVDALNRAFPEYVWAARENGPPGEDFDWLTVWPQTIVEASVNAREPA